MPRPEHILILVAVAMPALTLLIRRARLLYNLRGYRTVARELRHIAAAIDKGEIDRDGSDLLIRGNGKQFPCWIRLSQSDTQPALNIRGPFPLKATIYCSAREQEHPANATTVRTGDAWFDSRFRISTDQPATARILLASAGFSTAMRKLCCSSQTFVVIENDQIEVRELVVSTKDFASHVLNHLTEIGEILNVACQFPGAQPNKERVGRSGSWRRLAPYVLSPVLLIAACLTTSARRLSQQSSPYPVTEFPSTAGIPPSDASKIPDLQNWRLMEAADFDVNGNAWLQQQGQTPQGRITATFAGSGPEDSAYLLRAKASHATRLVVFVRGEIRYDAMMPIALAARVPKSSLGGITWRGRGPTGDPAGDGLLVVRKYDDPGSGMIFFFSGLQLMFEAPKDFRAVSFY